ncbi:MAG: XisH family protein [Thiomargarita sp.]|nr:XisH family protein [Thiomargarita sp.]
MPKRDIYHNTVRKALEKDNWIITDDPLKLKIGEKRLYVDIGAESIISAEKDKEKIAVEIKSFVGKSDVNDLEQALGQFFLYYKVISVQKLDHRLYLAVNEITFHDIFTKPIGQLLLADPIFRLIVFDEEKEVITQWIPN